MIDSLGFIKYNHFMNPNDYVYPVYHAEFKVEVMYTSPVQACVHHIWNTYYNAKYVYTGYEFSHNGLLSCQFKDVTDGYESSIGWFTTLDREKDKEYTLPLDVVAEQIVKNAKAGHAESVEFILTMSAEKADSGTSDSDKEKDDSDKDKQKCQPELDDVEEKTSEVEFRYCDLLIDRHGLYPTYKSTRNPHPKGYGSWDGHIVQYNKQRDELGELMTQLHLKNGGQCSQYMPKDTETWKEKVPPNQPSETLAKQLNCPEKMAKRERK